MLYEIHRAVSKKKSRNTKLLERIVELLEKMVPSDEPENEPVNLNDEPINCLKCGGKFTPPVGSKSFYCPHCGTGERQ